MSISDVACYFWFPAVAIDEEFFLVIKKFFTSFGAILKVRAFDNGVDWASFLAVTTKDAFSEINIVASGTARAIQSFLRLDGDCLRWADSLTELAGNAPLFA